MKTLDQHNAERRHSFSEQDELNKPHPNGIQCPNCDAELWDSNPMIVLTSYPAQKNVHCPECGYAGYRLA